LKNAEKRAESLYTCVVLKLNDDQFSQFVQFLKQSGNDEAYEIFAPAGVDIFLTKDEVNELREVQRNSVYEGTSREDDEVAETVVGYLRHKKLLDGNKLDPTWGDKRREVVPMIKKFLNAVREKRVWINPDHKAPLPTRDYTERRVRQFGKKWSFFEAVMKEDKLVLLADGPGTGKSWALTKLERDLRRNVPSPRIIIRKEVTRKCFDESLFHGIDTK